MLSIFLSPWSITTRIAPSSSSPIERFSSSRSLGLLHSTNYGSPRRRLRSSGTRNFANSQGKARIVRKAQKAQAWRRKGVLRNAAIQKRTRKRNPSPKANHPEYKTLCEKATLPSFSSLPNIYKPNSRRERSDEDEWKAHQQWRALPSPPKQHPIPLTEILSIPCLPRAAVAQHLPFLLALRSETTINLLRELSYATIKSLFVWMKSSRDAVPPGSTFPCIGAGLTMGMNICFLYPLLYSVD